jgi:2-keto-3-deoxy-L-rhamnonate aldolase RhmA
VTRRWSKPDSNSRSQPLTRRQTDGSDPPHLPTLLDAGAMGIMVPMVETAAQAKQIASWCRYRPDGVRGVAFGMPQRC